MYPEIVSVSVVFRQAWLSYGLLLTHMMSVCYALCTKNKLVLIYVPKGNESNEHKRYVTY